MPILIELKVANIIPPINQSGSKTEKHMRHISPASKIVYDTFCGSYFTQYLKKTDKHWWDKNFTDHIHHYMHAIALPNNCCKTSFSYFSYKSNKTNSRQVPFHLQYLTMGGYPWCKVHTVCIFCFLFSFAEQTNVHKQNFCFRSHLGRWTRASHKTK